MLHKFYVRLAIARLRDICPISFCWRKWIMRCLFCRWSISIRWLRWSGFPLENWTWNFIGDYSRYVPAGWYATQQGELGENAVKYKVCFMHILHGDHYLISQSAWDSACWIFCLRGIFGILQVMRTFVSTILSPDVIKLCSEIWNLFSVSDILTHSFRSQVHVYLAAFSCYICTHFYVLQFFSLFF